MILSSLRRCVFAKSSIAVQGKLPYRCREKQYFLEHVAVIVSATNKEKAHDFQRKWK